MNVTRIAVLAVAAIAAGVAVLLVRGMLGGGTPAVQASAPANYATVDVLVANAAVEPGMSLDPGAVHWEAWPKNAVAPTFLTKNQNPDIDALVKGAVVRAPLVAGEPITDAKIVRAGSNNFMAATIAPGKRAVSMPVNESTGAGGFILPNDRVDVVLTHSVGEGEAKKFEATTILHDVRVLAVDQVPQQVKDQKTVVAKTATLELAPEDVEIIAQAQASGTLSLALRGLGDNEVPDPQESRKSLAKKSGTDAVAVIRYGIGGGSQNNAKGGTKE